MFKKVKTQTIAPAIAALTLVSMLITTTGTSIPVAWWVMGGHTVWRGGW
ncbi:MAG: hypothetical protein QF357_08620 [Dehalococcoidia bacterium]|nr:hypothetical protein [Dehalococcoidia bacterium]